MKENELNNITPESVLEEMKHKGEIDEETYKEIKSCKKGGL